jgi:thiamine-monophosphate kinase
MREFDLLRHIYEHNDALGAIVEIPPGDDMAMVRFGNQPILAAVDQLVAGRHVELDRVPLALVGRKAITRCLSDVAAMAARPIASLAAATLPPGFGEANANALFDAMHETAQRYGSPIIGGDIAFHADDSHPLVCSVTVLAVTSGSNRSPITRSGAKPGDRLYVTGVLGGSYQPDGGGHHLTFEPRMDEAILLSELLGEQLHAMIDLSDGLGRDAAHIAERSRVRIVIDAARVPCRDGLDWRRAMSDGEDYELCFAAGGTVPNMLGSTPVTEIGWIEPRGDESESMLIVKEGDRAHDGADMGWEHHS